MMIARRSASFFALVSLSVVLASCVPVTPSDSQLRGRWRVVWECGTEAVELKTDGTYLQEIDYTAGGHDSHEGKWVTKPKESRLEGAHVVLQDALTFCTPFGEKLAQPERGDRDLEAVWEWGRLILSFNPDIQGFKHQ
jgi:hypothetical protein